MGHLGAQEFCAQLSRYSQREVGGDYTSDLETITQVMVSDTNPYDVLLLSLNYMPVDRLLKKATARI